MEQEPQNDSTPKSFRKKDEVHYQHYPDHAEPVAEALGRIKKWLEANSELIARSRNPQFKSGSTGVFNPPATVEQIKQAEERLGVTFPKSLSDAYLLHNGTGPKDQSTLYRWLPLEEQERCAGYLVGHNDNQPRLPVMETDGIVFFIETTTSQEDDPPVWLNDHEMQVDEKVADSFGAFLSQLADHMQRGTVIVDPDSGLINYWDEIYGSMTPSEVEEMLWEDVENSWDDDEDPTLD